MAAVVRHSLLGEAAQPGWNTHILLPGSVAKGGKDMSVWVMISSYKDEIRDNISLAPWKILPPE